MPKADRSPNTSPVKVSQIESGAEAAPGLARRSFLAGVAVMLPAAAAASAASAAPANPDAELIALAEAIVDLEAQCQAANAECERCYEIYLKIKPERPRALAWRLADPVGYRIEPTGEGKGRTWCDESDIEKLRGRTEFHNWIFTGTPEESEMLSLPNWKDNQVMPVVGYDHLFQSAGDEHRLKRAQELVAALDEYEAGTDAAEIASGSRAADEAFEAVHEKASDLCDRILELTPSTLAGYRAMATVIVDFCWSGDLRRGDTADKQMIATILASLSGVAAAA
jgi:hypothetical protein